MSHLLSFFKPKNHFQAIITSQHISNHALVPSDLIQEIRKNPTEFVKYISLQHQQSIKEIQKLALVHLLLIHIPQFTQLFQSLSLNIRSNDTWINDHLIKPYQNFIRKLLLSSEQYQKVRIINNGWNNVVGSVNSFHSKAKMRENPNDYFNFQILCYCINMLNELFAFLKKIPTLGRYYPKRQNSSYTSFVYIASYQTVIFYFAMRFIITELLAHHRDYLSAESELNFFKDILSRNLEGLNEQLKNLLLNKYYNPIEKGIKVCLFQVDKQYSETREALYELNIIQRQNHQQNRKNRLFLGKKIFGDGVFNSNSFEQSLLLINSREYREKDLQEMFGKQNISFNQLNKKASDGESKKRRGWNDQEIHSQINSN